MIGVFDSGHGGLTVLRALVQRFPAACRSSISATTATCPTATAPSDEIVALTRDGVDALFRRGCQLVLLGCNTATCVAARTLQKDWLPVSGWTRPQHPRHRRTDGRGRHADALGRDDAAVPAEVQHRPDRRVRHHAHHRLARLSGGDPQALPQGHGRAADLRGARRRHRAGRAGRRRSTRWSSRAWRACWRRPAAAPPHRAILGCTHFPLVEHLFRRHLPPFTRLLSQPEVVADSLEDYLQRHPHYADARAAHAARPAHHRRPRPGQPHRAHLLARGAGLHAPRP